MAKITTNLFGELAILPHPSETPIKETLEFLTDVLPSHNGKEKRIQLRSKPRQTFGYKVPTQAWQMASSFNTGYAAIRDRWAVPVWTESQYVGSVIQDASAIECNTSIYDLRPDSLAMLFTACNGWQVIEIVSVEPGQINIAPGVRNFAGAWLVPVRLGWIAGNINRPTNGHSGKTELTFEIDDNPLFVPEAPAQYDGFDIYYEPGLLSGASVSRSIEKSLDVTDYSLGPVSRRSPWLNSRFATPYRSLLEGMAQVHEYKNWLFRRAGKFRPFWFPTFEVNMRVKNAGNITSTLVIESDSYIAYAANRTRIAIQTTTGAWHIRTVSNPVQINADSVQLTLSSALNIHVNNVARVSFLGFNRLDADRIELNWNTNNVVEANVRILELNP